MQLAVGDWHAHVYFDGPSRAAAWSLRERIGQVFAGRMVMGRFHEKPVGPHPRWSFQIAFQPDVFADLVPWLLLNRDGLDMLVHPNTGDELGDHRDRAMWLGQSHDLDLSALDAG